MNDDDYLQRKTHHLMDGVMTGAEAEPTPDQTMPAGGNLTFNGPVNINHGQQQTGNQLGNCTPPRKPLSIVLPVLATFLIGAGAAYIATHRDENNLTFKQISQQTAEESVKQYGIASKHGDAKAVCVQAMTVAGWFLQAQDSAKYEQWKAIEKADCQKAGLH